MKNLYKQMIRIGLTLSVLIVAFKGYGQKAVSPVVFSTYYGNSGTDDADAVTVDTFGNTYLGCHSNSLNLLGAGKHSYTFNGKMDTFIVKLNSEGTKVSYLTHLGGSKWDAIQGLVTDASGNIYAIGTTYSSDFPIKSNGFQSKFGGKSDAFVVKLNSKGEVIWSTFLGGSNDEDGRDITIGQNGNIHVIGRTASNDFPILANALQPKSAGNTDVFVATFDTNGKIITSTYLGGSGNDIGFSIDQDDNGRLYIAGTTGSTNFPVHNAFQKENNGGKDLFFAVIDPTGKHLEYASYWGGSGTDKCYSLDVGPSGDLFIMGVTNSTDLAITQNAFQQTFHGATDVFISRLNLKNQSLVYSTYLGGKKDDSPRNLIVDVNDNAYVVGKTNSTNFPTTLHSRSKLRGKTDAFVTLLNAQGSKLKYSTLFGGKGKETFEGAAMNTDGLLTVSGLTNSTDFPLKNSLQDTFLGGRFDIVVTRFDFSNHK